jgi:hypothetical protein
MEQVMTYFDRVRFNFTTVADVALVRVCSLVAIVVLPALLVSGLLHQNYNI